MFKGYRQKSLVDQYGAGINGRKDLGIHLLVSAYPGYFDEDDPAEFGWANVMHEYFHISQLAHAEGDMGPVWWVEGTAQFLDKWLTEKLQSEGKLPILTEPFDFIGHMSWTLRDARRWWAEGNRLELEGGPELFLWLGPWTTAYLLNSIDNYRALQDIFYPNIRELGFEGSFERTFNIPYNDFNEIFRQFMEKPIEEQLSSIEHLIKSGKVRYFALSNEWPWGLMEFIRLAKIKNLPLVCTLQNSYSLINRIVELGMTEIFFREKLSFFSYSPLGFGHLSGKYLNDPKASGRVNLFPGYAQRLSLIHI